MSKLYYVPQMSAYDTNGLENKDAGIVVSLDNKPIFALGEERVSGVKHDGNLKLLALDNFIANNPDLINEYGYPEYIGENRPDNCQHHLDHVYDVFYNSGFKESAVLVIDGCGTENDSITLAYIKENEKPIVLKKFSEAESLGIMYSMTSHDILGNRFCEGKLMGLTSYGQPYNYHYAIFKDDHLEIDSDRLLKEIKEYSPIGNCDIMYYSRIAATVQRDFEECVLEIVKYLKKLLKDQKIKTDNLCLAGGCILNCPTNSKIVKQGLFKHFYSTSNPSDGGANTMGNLYRSLESKGFKLQSNRLSPFMGHNYTIEEIESSFRKYNNFYAFDGIDRISNLCSLLKAQVILAWYQGSSEWGPRALGHRSFLADPTTKMMIHNLNHIKCREMWRPLAPIVPEELFSMIFEDADGNNDMADLMLRTYTIKPEWRNKLQTVCHIDNTTRPQLLRESDNFELYTLLMEYYKLTGIPCLVNTSLNVGGRPMMDTPINNINMYDHFLADKGVIMVFNGVRFHVNYYK